MNYATASIQRNAKTTHKCSWCGQIIERETKYRRWAWFDEGTVSTIKMHLECHIACLSLDDREFYLYENARGRTYHKDDQY